MLLRDRRPLLKWAGGKRGVLTQLLALTPSHYEHYFEPFVGGGALFFALQPSAATLGDTNEELINCYVQVRDDPDAVVAALRSMPNGKDNYYRVRAWLPRDPRKRAARMIYVCALSFNGIYRVNLDGKFNVPYGNKTRLVPCDEDHIRNVSRILKQAKVVCRDFAATVAEARSGDFVYLDPPYTVAHQNNGFIKYNQKLFSWADQARLASVASDLAHRGCWVVVSHADHPSVRELFSDLECYSLQRASVIAASTRHRGHVSECVFSNVKVVGHSC